MYRFSFSQNPRPEKTAAALLFETVAPLGGAWVLNPLPYDFCFPPTHDMYNNTPLIAQHKKNWQHKIKKENVIQGREC